MHYLAVNYDKEHKLWPKVRAISSYRLLDFAFVSPLNTF